MIVLIDQSFVMFLPTLAPSDVIVLSSSEEPDPDTAERQTIVDVRSVMEDEPIVEIPHLSLRRQAVSNTPQHKTPKCPEYKIVAGTNFAVDAFRFGEMEGVKAYFLTHFHSDHYNGLTRKFNQPIYMSTITGELNKKKSW